MIPQTVPLKRNPFVFHLSPTCAPFACHFCAVAALGPENFLCSHWSPTALVYHFSSCLQRNCGQTISLASHLSLCCSWDGRISLAYPLSLTCSTFLPTFVSVSCLPFKCRLFVWILLFLHLSPMANGFHDRQQSALDISSFCLGSGIISFSFFWDPFWVCLKTKKTAAWFFMFFQHSWNFWKAFSSSSAIRPGQINSVSTLSWQILWSQWCWAHRDVERWPFQALRHCHARYNAKVC